MLRGYGRLSTRIELGVVSEDEISLLFLVRHLLQQCEFRDQQKNCLSRIAGITPAPLGRLVAAGDRCASNGKSATETDSSSQRRSISANAWLRQQSHPLHLLSRYGAQH